ncbi:hypothetical protein D1013_16810 [Euzebyella marina]|uniref:Uncharacterized protein n=1 Tax=Euzebyella marina TaxID=1761453 RepID=A0A3G2L9K8_9FLAO|nr:hypothetical protein [Euzebyella marina]AYN68920.1 hypothetical protein D1013_16810 [Euzebyella marina]MAU72000.1 hypothetical protein [Pseudozobellia sp.]MBG47841.1 hypothetical protein [Pseudozobellia sp.]|tara:strand:+ start:375 stop:656 length:282 start_codon:yes stop_codon:yes gene_type:complete
MSLIEQILAKLKECQKDYYSRQNAVEAYQTLSNNMPDIKFNSEKSFIVFEENLAKLKQSMSIADQDLFAQNFASACLNLTLALRIAHSTSQTY